MAEAKKIVLAIDDMPETLASVRVILKDKYDVRCISDAKTALAALPSLKPSLILLDIEMPGMSGIEFLEELKKNESLSVIPVICLTANTDGQTAQKAIRDGAKGYIVKPITPESLLESVAFFS